MKLLNRLFDILPNFLKFEEIQETSLIVKSTIKQSIVLLNGLEVLLVHNQNFKKSCVYLTIDAGGVYNPIETPGLAHLFEHMIFQGSGNEANNQQGNNKNALLNFILTNSGLYTASTTYEAIDFLLQVPTYSLEKACNMFVEAVANPIFSKMQCEKEIEIVNQEFERHVHDEGARLLSMILLAFDKSLPENRFLCGNKATLSDRHITEKLEEFHRKYCTAGRMKLVIVSKLSIDKQIKLAQKFEVINEDKTQAKINKNIHLQKDDLRLNEDKTQTKINKNIHLQKDDLRLNEDTSTETTNHATAGLENNIVSLLKETNAVKYSNEFAGSIVKYQVNNDTSHLYITITFPSVMSHLKYRPMEYITELFTSVQDGSPHRELARQGLATELGIITTVYRRYSMVRLFFDLTAEGLKRINEVHQVVYDFIHMHQPDESIFERIKKKEIEDSTDSHDDLAVVLKYSNASNSKNHGSFKINRKATEDMLNELGNIRNWLSLIGQREANFEHVSEYFNVKYTTPQKFVPKDDLTVDLIKKSHLLEETKKTRPVMEWIDELKSRPSTVYSIGQAIKMSNLIQKYRKHGEYVILHNSACFGDECSATIELLANQTEKQAAEVFLLVTAFLNRFYVFPSHNEVKMKIEALNTSSRKGLEIVLEGRKSYLIPFLRLVWGVLKAFKIGQKELLEVKRLAKSDIENQKIKSDDFTVLIDSFKKLIFKAPLNSEIFKEIDSSNCGFISGYYTSITASGNINENDIESIYEMIKSSGDKSLSLLPSKLPNELIYKTEDKSKNMVIMAYEIKNPVKSWPFRFLDSSKSWPFRFSSGALSWPFRFSSGALKSLAISMILRPILAGSFYNFVRVEYPVAYANSVDTVKISHRNFIVFRFQSTEKKEFLQEILKRFVAKIKNIVENVEQLEKLKIGLCESLPHEINTLEDLLDYTRLLKESEVFDLNYVNILKRTILSLTVQDIIQATLSMEGPVAIYFLKDY